MKKRYLSIILTLLLAVGTALMAASSVNAEYSDDESVASSKANTGIVVASADNTDDENVTEAESLDQEESNNTEQAVDTEKYMSFDSSINLVSSNKTTADITLLSGNTELDECSIVFAITFDGQEAPCKIITPSGQSYTSSSVDSYTTSELVGLGTIAYYRINNIELGTYTITSSGSIFNCSVDMGLTDQNGFMVDEQGQLDDSRTGNVMSQDEYDAYVEEIVENESEEETLDEEVLKQGGVSLEGQTEDIDASNGDSNNVDSTEEYNKQLQEELEELRKD